MLLGSFDLTVTHSTFCVYDQTLDDCPYNEVTEATFNQGFSWRECSVCFYTPRSTLGLRVSVELDTQYAPTAVAQRIIRVPFLVKGTLGVAMEDVMQVSTSAFDIPPGWYTLTYEVGFCETSPTYDEAGFAPGWVHLWFEKSNSAVEPTILRQDNEMNPTYPLTLSS